jgi:hypothetical protein
VPFLDLDRVVEACLLHLAAAAERTSSAFTQVLLGLALEVARGEEEDSVLSAAFRIGAPRGVVVHLEASEESLGGLSTVVFVTSHDPPAGSRRVFDLRDVANLAS